MVEFFQTIMGKQFFVWEVAKEKYHGKRSES